jgi:hypothetical protein
MNRLCRGHVPLIFMFSVCYWQTSKVNAVTPSTQIYWTDDFNFIRRANLDGSNPVNVLDGSKTGNIGDFVVDQRTNLLYINDGFNIFRGNIDGTNLTRIFQFPPLSFEGDVALDPITNKLFFVDGRNNVIYRSSLDGASATAIVPAHGQPSNGDGITDLWVDSAAGKLYWNFASEMHRTNLDGSQDELLFSNAFGIRDFEIDPQHGKIYWASITGGQGGGAIRRANLDGTQQQTLVSGLWFAQGISLDVPNNRMYYTDSWYSGPTNYDGTIRVANLDGTGAQVLINVGSVVRPYELSVITSTVPEPSGILLLLTGLIGFVSTARVRVGVVAVRIASNRRRQM